MTFFAEQHGAEREEHAEHEYRAQELAPEDAGGELLPERDDLGGLRAGQGFAPGPGLECQRGEVKTSGQNGHDAEEDDDESYPHGEPVFGLPELGPRRG